MKVDREAMLGKLKNSLMDWSEELKSLDFFDDGWLGVDQDLERQLADRPEVEKRAGFLKFMMAKREEKISNMERVIDCFESVGFGLELVNDKQDCWACVMEDASEPGAFRFQMYNEDGFYSHVTRNTIEDTLKEVCEYGFNREDQGAMERLSKTERWEYGMAATAIIQAVNSGQISWREGNDKIDAMAKARQARDAEKDAETGISKEGIVPSRQIDGTPQFSERLKSIAGEIEGDIPAQSPSMS